MTAPNTSKPWEQQIDPNVTDAADKITSIAAGNPNLVTEPGLVQALAQGNATQVQAQAINQFLFGLKAEQKVRLAAANSQRIMLSPLETQTLDAMGIDYTPVYKSPASARQDIIQQMADKGARPVLTTDGQFQYDANGNIRIQSIAKPAPAAPKKPDGWFDSVGGFFHHLTHNPVTNLVGKGSLDPNNPFEQGPLGEAGVQGAFHATTGLWQYTSATVNDIQQWTHGAQAVANAMSQNNDLAQSLGYDPNSFISMQAFKAHGYEHTDLSHLANEWDSTHPNGVAGWDGAEAVRQAALAAADPTKWRQAIENDPGNYQTGPDGKPILTEQGAQRLGVLGDKNFSDLITQVKSRQSSIGNEVANALGIDPIEHPTYRAFVNAGAEIGASFALDPLGFGINAATQAAKSTVALRNLADGEGIRKVLLAEDGIKSVKQANQIRYVKDMVDSVKELNEAKAAGEDVKVAQITARLQAGNPYAGLLPEFTGQRMILNRAAMLTGKNGTVTFRPGMSRYSMIHSTPITSYEEAVDYMASKDALLRLTGGYAPVESRLMPGAMSSYGFNKLKGSISAWSAGRSLDRAKEAADKYLGWATADPGRLSSAIQDGYLAKFDPHLDDAVNPVTGEPLFGAFYQVTDKGLGMLRREELTYGGHSADMSAVGKVLGWGTKGMAARARLALSRLGNTLPTSTKVSLDDNSSVWAIRKIARTYLTSGDGDMLAARWMLGNAQTRKTIVEGLKDQIAEAAGLNKTASFRIFGRDIFKSPIAKLNNEREALVSGWGSEVQHYSVRPDLEWTDANGRPGALFPGQVQTEFTLPSFGAVHHAAVKVGLYEATLGRMLSSRTLDQLMGQWKVGVLAKPTTATRAIIESWLNAASEGMFGTSLQSKALLRELGRMDTGDVARLKGTEKLASFGPMVQLGRFYRHVILSSVPKEALDEAINMPEDLLHLALYEQSALHQAVTLDPAGIGTITRGYEAGLKPGRVTYDTKNAWSDTLKRRVGYQVTDEVDGAKGADAYAHTLGMRVNDSPEVARAIVRWFRNQPGTDLAVPDKLPLPRQLGNIYDDIVKALDDEKLMQHTMYGKTFKLGEAVTGATTPEQILTGKRQWAASLVEDFRKLVTGRNGKLQDQVLDYIDKTGEAPKADWILNHVKGLDRPEHVLAPVYMDLPLEGGVKGTVKRLYELQSRGYQRLVEIPIQRHATGPLFHAALIDSKLGLNQTLIPKLVSEGFSKESANKLAWDIAAGQAWQRVARMLDDPHMKTQLDVVGRGFFAFSRATTMMARRWGGTFWRNPVMARRLQLATEGSISSGLTYQDENGDWVTTIPLSGVAMEVLQHVMSVIPGFHDMVYVPTADLQGRVTSIIPGSDAPWQYSTTPLVSLSSRWIASNFPEHREWFDHVDQALNGSLGQGRGIADTLEPSLIKSLVTDPGFFNAKDPEAIRNQMLASAMVGTLYTMAAAGTLPSEQELADPAARDHWLKQFRRGVMSNLFTKGLFGAFSPATLDSPEGAGFTADEAWRVTGARNLRAEYKEILNDVNGDSGRANAIWMRLHPDQMVFTQSGSQSTTKDATMASTDQAFKWMAVHKGFINDYQQVAAYFMPQPSKGDKFSLDAYHAQIEEGFRQRKTPAEFADGVRLSQDISDYFDGGHGFPGEAGKNKALAAAVGNQDATRQVNQAWDAASKQFQEQHPLFHQWLTAHSQGGAVADQQVRELRRMVQNNAVPGSAKTALVLKGMLAAYDGYEAYVNSHPDSTSKLGKAQHQMALSMLQGYLASAVTEAPELMGVYNGVFRVLNSNLDPVTQEAQV